MAKEVNTFQVSVITPKGTAYEGNANFLKVHAEGGELGVIKDHSPTLAKLVPGEVIIRPNDETTEYFFIIKGYAEILRDKVTILTPFFESSKDLDIERAKSAEKRAQERLDSTKSGIDIARAKNALLRAKSRLYLHAMIEKATNKN